MMAVLDEMLEELRKIAGWIEGFDPNKGAYVRSEAMHLMLDTSPSDTRDAFDMLATVFPLDRRRWDPKSLVGVRVALIGKNRREIGTLNARGQCRFRGLPIADFRSRDSRFELVEPEVTAS